MRFHPAYNGNCLVNAFAAGLAETDKIFYSAASGIGMPVVYLGAKTGRDGVGGATMASAEFGADTEAKRPTVQVGDPFTEKLLLEATLEIIREDLIVGIQDMGAAGITCSSCEMSAKGESGMDLDLDRVDAPQGAAVDLGEHLNSKRLGRQLLDGKGEMDGMTRGNPGERGAAGGTRAPDRRRANWCPHPCCQGCTSSLRSMSRR